MEVNEFLKEWHDDSPLLLVHTSGSTGAPKPLLVEKKRMINSARITCDFLGLHPGDTVLLCMSLDYIAGKMVVVRSIERGLRLISVAPSGHPLREVEEHINFAAMVPLQVFNSISVPDERRKLMNIDNLIIGGGAIDDDLEKELRLFPNAVWATYGMTETLSHIALRSISGSQADEWFRPFSSVKVKLNDEGCLVINAPLVCKDILTTNDCAEIKDNSFRIIGRKDNVICSGGIKIQIEEVEKVLRRYLSRPFAITKRKDIKFGETVVLLTEDNDVDKVRDCCLRSLPKYWMPHAFYHIKKMPMTETGKLARATAEQIVRNIEKGTL